MSNAETKPELEVREKVFGWKAIAELAEIHPSTARRAVLGEIQHPLKDLVKLDPVTNRPFLYLEDFLALQDLERPYHIDPPKRRGGPGTRGSRAK